MPEVTGMYELISRNKRNSWLLVIILVLTIVIIAIVFGYWRGGQQFGAQNAITFAIIGILFASTGALVSYFEGASLIMAVSRARPADPDSERQLHNLVEEMTIASGLPKPKLYIIEDSAPNAFACGRNPENSAIAVTRGLMNKLNREELQGVIAHEMSHILSYDILFVTIVTVLVGSIVMLCDVFRWMSIFGGGRRRENRRSGGGQIEAVIAIVALLLMILAPIFAQLIQLAASRQREYLADANGAKMTRNPKGLASALRKISTDTEKLEAANRGTQHLYIVNPLKGKAASNKQSLFSTHPPIEERINRLEEMT